jgi:hypothetical protein
VKLSITQIALGVLIILAACYVTGWMIHKAPGQLRQPVVDNAGKTTYIDAIPESEALFNIARYSSYVLPVIGIFLVIAGTVQAARGRVISSGLAVSCIIAGALIVASGFIITNYGYPTTFHAPHGAPDGSYLTIFANYGRSLTFIRYLSASLVLPGLAAVGVGIAQLAKSRKPAAS